MDYESFIIGLILGSGLASCISVVIIDKVRKMPHGLRTPQQPNIPPMPKRKNKV